MKNHFCNHEQAKLTGVRKIKQVVGAAWSSKSHLTISNSRMRQQESCSIYRTSTKLPSPSGSQPYTVCYIWCLVYVRSISFSVFIGCQCWGGRQETGWRGEYDMQAWSSAGIQPVTVVQPSGMHCNHSVSKIHPEGNTDTAVNGFLGKRNSDTFLDNMWLQTNSITIKHCYHYHAEQCRNLPLERLRREHLTVFWGTFSVKDKAYPLHPNRVAAKDNFITD